MAIKENVLNKDIWLRGLFIFIFSVIAYISFWIIGAIVFFQFFTQLITKKINSSLLSFSASLSLYVAQIINYVTFTSDHRPFPFDAWPVHEKTTDVASERNKSKKTARKTPQKSNDDTA